MVPASPILWTSRAGPLSWASKIPTERESGLGPRLWGEGGPAHPRNVRDAYVWVLDNKYPESDCVRYVVGHLLQLTHSHKKTWESPHPRILGTGSLEKRKSELGKVGLVLKHLGSQEDDHVR